MILYFISSLLTMFGMEVKKDTHPAYSFMEAVSKRASDEGWTLNLSTQGFVWRDSKGNIFGEQWPMMNPGQLLHQACMFLEKHQKWELTG